MADIISFFDRTTLVDGRQEDFCDDPLNYIDFSRHHGICTACGRSFSVARPVKLGDVSTCPGCKTDTVHVVFRSVLRSDVGTESLVCFCGNQLFQSTSLGLFCPQCGEMHCVSTTWSPDGPPSVLVGNEDP